VRGRLVVIGGITGYATTGFPDVNIPDLPGKLILGSYTIVGFFLANYRHKFKEYLAKLIDLVAKGKIKILVDLGKNSKDGAFQGIEGVARG
jgi:NADPH-dependent curcumin reductase CurA